MTGKEEFSLTPEEIFRVRTELSVSSRKKKRREGTREKKAFLVRYLTMKIFWESYKNPKEHKNWRQCFDEAEDQLGEIGSHALASFYKRRREDSGFFSMLEVYYDCLRMENFFQQADRLRNLPPQYIETSERNDDALAVLISENRLIERVMKQLRRSPRLSQRELCRKLNVKLSFLQPILEILEYEHFIVWDRSKKTISTDLWNPRDDRQFIWLADSCYPCLGPKLEKGYVHRFSDYNGRAVEKWIKDGAAELYLGR